MFDTFFENWNRKKLKNRKFDFLFEKPLANEYIF